MKQLFAIMLALVLVLACVGCTGETEPKYVMTESVYEFADQVQRTVYHFDENGTSTGYTVYTNDEVTQEVTMELDEQGNICKVTGVSGGVTSVEEYVNTYDEKGNLVKQETYADGTLTRTQETVYDAEGNRASLTQTTVTAMGEYINTITFNTDGKMLRMVNISPDGSESGGDYTYDESGRKVKFVNYYLADGQRVTTETTTEYNSDGTVYREIIVDYDAQGNAVDGYETRYSYDGNTTTSQNYRDGVAEGAKTVVTTDDVGNTLSQEFIYENGEVTRFSYSWRKVE